MHLSAEVLRDLNAIAPEWWDLFSRAPDATPFQSPAWLLPWWNSFGRGEPLLIAVRDHRRLLGLGTFYFYDGDPSLGTQLYLLGKGTSDYLDLVIASDSPEQRGQVAQAIFDRVYEFTQAWHVADFDRLRPESAVLQVHTPPWISAVRMEEGGCPQVHLRGTTVKEFVKKSTRHQLRKHFNRAGSMGKLEFEMADAQNCQEVIGALKRLHTANWNGVGRPGVFADPAMANFISNAAHELLQHKMLRLYALLLDNEIVAVAMAMLHWERLYFYLCDFDPSFATISPGTMLTAHAMEQAAREGARFFDFLQGNESYKFEKWGAQPRLTYRVRQFAEAVRAAA